MTKRVSQAGNEVLVEEQEETIRDAALLLDGCKMGTSFLSVECWHGQAGWVLLKRSDSSTGVEEDRRNTEREHGKLKFQLSESEWIQNMNSWFSKAQTYSTTDIVHLEQKLASLDMGIKHRLPYVDPTVWEQDSTQSLDPITIQSDSDGEGMRVLLKCLMQGAQCSELLVMQELVVPYVKKSPEVIEIGYRTQLFSSKDEEIS